MNFSLVKMRKLGKLLPNGCYVLRKLSGTQTYPCFFSQDAPVLPPKPKSDPVILALKAAVSTPEALKVIGIHAAHMEPEHVSLSLRTLTNLQKYSSSGLSENEVLNSNEFLFLCRRLKKQLPVLEVGEVLDALKTVTLFKVPHNSDITMKLLHMIKRDINVLSIGQITFLAFLMRQYPRNPVADALKIALPVVFETQLKTKLNRSNLPCLVDAIIYCSKNDISRESIDYVVDALCELDPLDWATMDPRKARSIAIALSDLAINSPAYETVYRDAIVVVPPHLDKFSFIEVDVLLGAILKKMRRAPYLYYAPLFESALEVAANSGWSITECSIILRKANSVGVTSRRLLDVMADMILDDPERFREGKFGLVKTFINGLSIANYKTDYWNLLKDLLPTSNCFQNIQPKEPWIPLCLELASLDIYSDKLLSQVFSNWFLEGYLSREYNKLDLLQLLKLHQTVAVLHTDYSGPLPSQEYLDEAKAINGANVTVLPMRGVLENELGRNCVLSHCKTDMGHVIDHVVVLQPGGDPVIFPEELNSNEIVSIDKLIIPPNCQRVALFLLSWTNYNSLNQLRGCSSLNMRVLEALGYLVVHVALETWNEMPDWEKTPYLMQQMRLKCSHLYRKEESVP